jgi:hypothetical protein
VPAAVVAVESVMTGVMGSVVAVPVTVTVALPRAVSPAVFLASHVRVRVPALPAVKVRLLEAAPAVIVPPEMVQLKVTPVWLGTEAVRPVAPAVAVELETVTSTLRLLVEVELDWLEPLPHATNPKRNIITARDKKR